VSQKHSQKKESSSAEFQELALAEQGSNCYVNESNQVLANCRDKKAAISGYLRCNGGRQQIG
jgi:hypothetical protein